MQRLADLTGEQFDASGTRQYTGAWLFHHLLRRGLLLTDNVRVPARLTWPARNLKRDPRALSLQDGSELPLYLFRLSTGDSQQREDFERICGHFHDLTGSRLAITFKPKGQTEARTASAAPLLGRNGFAAAGPGLEAEDVFELVPVVQTTIGEVPMEFAGAGAWEAAVLCALLAARGRIVVLDEPALNLHPTRQRRLLETIRSSECQVLLVTHSPYMVPATDPRDLARVVRFALHNETTRVYRITPGAYEPPEQQRMVRWLSELTEVRAFLFARGVILVEGGTEYGALSTWFAKSAEASGRQGPEDLNLLLFDVGGDQKFRPFITVLNAFGIPWGVVCDGKVFRDRQERGSAKASIFRQMIDAGVDAGVHCLAETESFAEAKSVGASNGVFTLASGFDEENESYLRRKFPEEFEKAGLEWRSKVMVGRAIAQQAACPPEVDELYARILERLGVTRTLAEPASKEEPTSATLNAPNPPLSGQPHPSVSSSPPSSQSGA
jgi:hypothetical protein